MPYDLTDSISFSEDQNEFNLKAKKEENTGSLFPINKKSDTKEKVRLFMSLFKGREDVYAKRFGDVIFKFDGKTYQETYKSAQDDKFIGQTFHYDVSINNDTMTCFGPVGEGESDKLGCVVLEKFVRE